MAVITRRNRPNYTDDTLKSIGDHVVRMTITVKENGLRIRWENLDKAETDEVVQLTRDAEGQAQEGGGGFSLDRLSKRKRERWERLIAKGAGEPESFFSDRRAAAEISTLARETVARIARRPLAPREELGLLATVAGKLRSGHLWADHVALIVLIACQWETGMALAPNATVDRTGGIPALTIDPGFGVAGANRDPFGSLARWQETIKWLEAQHWLDVERAGNRWTIMPGSRLIAALRALEAKPKKAAA